MLKFPTDEIRSLLLSMPEGSQRLWDAHRLTLRELPTGEPVLQVEKSLDVAVKFDEGSDLVSIVASTGDVDRYGDVVDPAGWDLAHYVRNPVILADHSYEVASIVGHAVSARTTPTKQATADDDAVQAKPGSLELSVKLDPADSSEQTRTVRAKLASRSLRTVSVGFRPLAYNLIRDSEDNWTGGYLFKESELLEVSFVAVPANPFATVQDSIESVDAEVALAEHWAMAQLALRLQEG